jgi:hypothetical protein
MLGIITPKKKKVSGMLLMKKAHSSPLGSGMVGKFGKGLALQVAKAKKKKRK